ncbi:hypothetical protein [Spirosoma sp. KNUC1025]|uniref:hypothetical protein n=1 Tax=Spirosoma sp. KNUC1025 TaxID=2894082 RepID=UPI0038691890|nr:hypothetical protein LN737_25780 [Spirosoma sp. KNUC1025]
MNKHIFILPVAAFVALLAPQIDPANVVQVAKIHQQNEADEQPLFLSNPLTLNGKTLDHATFSIISQGKLAVVAGNPETEEATKIPFRIYIRRGSTVLQEGASGEVYDVDIASVLAFAQLGDELVIDPVRETDEPARRVLKVKVLNLNWLFRNWVSPGC